MSSPMGRLKSRNSRVIGAQDDDIGIGQVAGQDGGGGVAGQQELAVRDGDLVVVDVQHPRRRVGLVGDLVHVAEVGMPEPRSRNWVMPCSIRNRTARRRNDRLEMATCRPSGSTCSTFSPTARSAAKLCAPPSR
ncbi:hypothetical protein GCM10018954_079990 [Kutzneria kofuensis]